MQVLLYGQYPRYDSGAIPATALARLKITLQKDILRAKCSNRNILEQIISRWTYSILF